VQPTEWQQSEIRSTPQLATGVQAEQHGLLTRIATESVSLWEPMK
jgi:hypothetical protein